MTIQEGGAGNGTTAPYAGGTHQFSFGQEVTLTATPYDSSTFDLWGITTNIAYKTGSSSSTNPATFIINGTGTITANYKLKTYNVTVTNANTGWGTVSASDTVEYGKNFAISATPATNYDFDKWAITSGSSFTSLQSAAASASNALVAVKGAVTVQAGFVPEKYPITIAQNPTGAGNLPVTGVQQIAFNDTFSLSAAANAGYTFSGWTIEPAGSMILVAGDATTPSITLRVDTTGTITANFSGVTYTVTVQSSNTNYGTVTPTAPTSVSYNGALDILATPKRGCKFSKWTLVSGTAGIADETNDTTKVTGVQSAVTVRADFETIPAVSGVVYVDSAANPAGLKTGASWFNAYTSLAKACTTTAAGARFWVAKGTYKPTDEISIVGAEDDYAIELQPFDSIYGGFNGTETSLAQRGNTWKTYKSIANGDVGSIGSPADNSTTVFLLRENTLIDGFTITDAKTAATLTILDCTMRNCIVQNCSAKALKVGGKKVTITECVFENNTATGGSAITVSGDSVLIQNSLFLNNVATTASAAAVYASSAKTVFIVLCTFINNRSESSGQTAVIGGTTKTKLIGSVFYGNRANNGSGDQVQISSFTGMTIEDCAVEDIDGKAISGTGTIVNCIISSSFETGFTSPSSPKGLDALYFTTDDGFTLQSNSVLIDKTNYKAIPPFQMSDIDAINKKRTYGAYDIGAYER